MKRLLLVSLIGLLLASCGGETSSTSRFVPPPEPSSSQSEASASYSGSLPMETAEERAEKIIADQSSLSDYYTDYKMLLTKVDDSTLSNTFVYSSKHDFYSAITDGNEAYLVTIGETRTLITVRDGTTTSTTDEAAIQLSSATFGFIITIKDLALNILEGAFNPERDATVIDASIDENDNFKVTIDTGTFLTSFYALVDLTFSSASLPIDMTMKITEGTYAGNHVSFSFIYGTSEEDRSYPAI